MISFLLLLNFFFQKALMGFDYELYEAPDRKFGSMSEVRSIEGLLFWMNNP